MMYNDRYNNPNGMSQGYGMPYRIPQHQQADPYSANPTRMSHYTQPQYSGGQVNRPGQEYAQPVTDGEQTPPWQGFGRRPYWANSTYLYGGMGGMRPGMPMPYRPPVYNQPATNAPPYPSSSGMFYGGGPAGGGGAPRGMAIGQGSYGGRY